MIYGDSMKENSGKTKYIVLGLLAYGPQTGYTIKKCIENEYSHFWQASFGQIYPTFKTLVQDGLAECTNWQQMREGRGQKSYRITEKGRDELKKWLSQAPDVEKLRYEILLKISFGSNTDSEVILKHLDDFIKRNEKLIKDMEGFLDMFEDYKNKGEDYTYHQLTALCGKYIYTAMKDWAYEAKNIILDRKAKPYETKNS